VTLTVEDAVNAHNAALDLAFVVGFDIFIVSAPPPFDKAEAAALKRDAAAVIVRRFPGAPELFAQRVWPVPDSLSRAYDASHAGHRLDFRCRTSFGELLAAFREDREPPFVHDPSYFSPNEHTLDAIKP
jgi:nucleoside-diphosphate-sugar epimerase